jgi:hypothetical protein
MVQYWFLRIMTRHGEEELAATGTQSGQDVIDQLPAKTHLPQKAI